MSLSRQDVRPEEMRLAKPCMEIFMCGGAYHPQIFSKQRTSSFAADDLESKYVALIESGLALKPQRTAYSNHVF